MYQLNQEQSSFIDEMFDRFQCQVLLAVKDDKLKVTRADFANTIGCTDWQFCKDWLSVDKALKKFNKTGVRSC